MGQLAKSIVGIRRILLAVFVNSCDVAGIIVFVLPGDVLGGDGAEQGSGPILSGAGHIGIAGGDAGAAGIELLYSTF